MDFIVLSTYRLRWSLRDVRYCHRHRVCGSRTFEPPIDHFIFRMNNDTCLGKYYPRRLLPLLFKVCSAVPKGAAFASRTPCLWPKSSMSTSRANRLSGAFPPYFRVRKRTLNEYHSLYSPLIVSHFGISQWTTISRWNWSKTSPATRAFYIGTCRSIFRADIWDRWSRWRLFSICAENDSRSLDNSPI